MLLDNIYLYNTLGWATFPVDCKTKTVKTPWATRQPDLLQVAQEEQMYTRLNAFGIKLNPDDLIIDIDPRNFKDGVNSWKTLCTDFNLTIEQPVVVATGGGGLHLYFKKPKDTMVVSHLQDYPGLDILAGNKNKYIVGPGSLHPSGKIYQFQRDSLPLDQVYMVPTALLDVVKALAPVKLEGTGEFLGGQQEYDRYVAYLTKVAVQEKDARGGDPQRFRTTCMARDYGLTPEGAFQALSEHYNPVCDPVWSDEKLSTCVKNAYTYASGTIGSEDPAIKFEKLDVGHAWDEEPNEDRSYKCKKDKAGRDIEVLKTLKNAVNYLYNTPELANTMRSNQFTGDIEVTSKLPWQAKRQVGDIWTDEDVVALKYYIAKRLGVEFVTNMLWDALRIASLRFAYHPIRDYVNSITWDGKSRVNTWLTDFCGVELNQYTQAVGRKMLVAMIARVFHPGVKFDYCPVLEGAQGIGKSTICAILGGKWYADIVLDPHARDTVDAMRGKWIIELSEMDVTRRAEAQALKAFISRTADRTRLAYARVTQDFPRQCVFVGTINPDDFGYLTDNTGNRRFWPLDCGGGIKMEELKVARDQLFAEAYKIYKGKKEEFFLSRDVLAHAEFEQSKRVIVDPWQDTLSTWLDQEAGRSVEELTVAQVWETVMGGNAKDLSRSNQIRIGHIMKRLGWWKTRPARGGSREYVYKRPNTNN